MPIRRGVDYKLLKLGYIEGPDGEFFVTCTCFLLCVCIFKDGGERGEKEEEGRKEKGKGREREERR